jgi:hypothetical protein
MVDFKSLKQATTTATESKDDINWGHTLIYLFIFSFHIGLCNTATQLAKPHVALVLIVLYTEPSNRWRT